MKQSEYQKILDACGGSFEPLSGEEIRPLLQAWREVFAAGLFAATGRWKLGPYEWHAFSFEHSQALNGAAAIEAYLTLPPVPVVVSPEAVRLPAVRLTGERFPNFAHCPLDIYVFPESLDWTMAFTHEASLGLGPYFSRRWAARPDRPPPSLRGVPGRPLRGRARLPAWQHPLRGYPAPRSGSP